MTSDEILNAIQGVLLVVFVIWYFGFVIAIIISWGDGLHKTRSGYQPKGGRLRKAPGDE